MENDKTGECGIRSLKLIKPFKGRVQEKCIEPGDDGCVRQTNVPFYQSKRRKYFRKWKPSSSKCLSSKYLLVSARTKIFSRGTLWAAFFFKFSSLWFGWFPVCDKWDIYNLRLVHHKFIKALLHAIRLLII